MCHGSMKNNNWRQLIDRHVVCAVQQGQIFNDPVSLECHRVRAIGTWACVLGAEFRMSIAPSQIAVVTRPDDTDTFVGLEAAGPICDFCEEPLPDGVPFARIKPKEKVEFVVNDAVLYSVDSMACVRALL